jgi:hypothetical protein
MKTVELKLYKFDELSEKAQAKAIEKNRDINVEDHWHDFVTDEWVDEIIPGRGFKATNTAFTGFWSQGDGAMFEYDGINDDLFNEFLDSLGLSPMRTEWIKTQIYVSVSGKQSGRYCHEKSCSHSIYWEVNNGDLHYSTNFHQWLMSFAGDFEAFIVDKYEDICRDLYNALEESYDYLTDDRQVAETLYANDYDFTEDGDMY